MLDVDDIRYHINTRRTEKLIREGLRVNAQSETKVQDAKQDSDISNNQENMKVQTFQKLRIDKW